MVLVYNVICKHCSAEILKESIIKDQCPKCGKIYNKTPEEDRTSKHINQMSSELSNLISSFRVYKFMSNQYPTAVTEKATWLIQELERLKRQLQNGTKEEKTL